MPAGAATDALVGFLVRAQDGALPESVLWHTRRALFDGCASMLAATSPDFDLGAALRRYAQDAATGGPATALTLTRRTDPETAALVNGAFAYYCDSEPHHPGAILHAFAAVGPAALAVAEAVGASGRQFLHALAAGVDVACRMSYALSGAALYRRGFHPSAVAGTFGAAAAACVLHGSRDDEVRSALGHAAAQASGLLTWVADATEHSRPLNLGLAARQGVTAARLAVAGVSGPPDPLEATYPAWVAFSGEWHPEAITRGLGERFLIGELWFKTHACCALLHPGVDGLLAILSEERVPPEAINSIELCFPESGYRVIDGNPLRSHCAQYVLPLAAVRGAVRFSDIVRDARSCHPHVAALGNVTTVTGDAELDRTFPEQYRSIVRVEADGAVHERDVAHPRGAPEAPLTDEELLAKARRLTATVPGDPDMARLQQIVTDLEEAADVSALVAALAGRPDSPNHSTTRETGR